jgi:hypothetical protein
MGEIIRVYRVLVGKAEGKKTTWKTQGVNGRIVLK